VTNGIWKAKLYRLDSNGRNPVRLWTAGLSHSVFTADRQGQLVFASNGEIVVRTKIGKMEGFRGNGTVAVGQPPLGDVSALVWGTNETLYLCDGQHIRKVDMDGKIRLVKTLQGRPSVPLYASRNGELKIWGMAVEDRGRVFVAVPSNAQVVRVDPNGKTAVVAVSQDDWHATGVAVSGAKLYLLETKLEGNRNLGPRVRMISSDTTSRIIGSVRQR